MTKLFISHGTGHLRGSIVVSALNIQDAERNMRIKVGIQDAEYLTKPQCVKGLLFNPTINNPRFCINGIIGSKNSSEYSVDIDYHE